MLPAPMKLIFWQSESTSVSCTRAHLSVHAIRCLTKRQDPATLRLANLLSLLGQPSGGARTRSQGNAPRVRGRHAAGRGRGV